ncbi:hypothetical protein HN51_029507 [Arachis hypogaea]
MVFYHSPFLYVSKPVSLCTVTLQTFTISIDGPSVHCTFWPISSWSTSDGEAIRSRKKFGQVELVHLPLDENGHCKGFGFVQFARLEDARARNARSLNGQLEIGGRTIKVSAITDQSGMQAVGGNTGDLDDD